MTVIPNTVQKGGKGQLFPPFTNDLGRTQLECDDIKCEPITGIEFFERDETDIVEQRQECRVNNFPNTEFALYRKSNTLLMFFGESWAYGGKIRDMVPGMATQESDQSVLKGVTLTVGPKMSQVLNSDLYQSAWPGDQTTNMFEKAERMIPQWIDNYSKVKVCIQITDPHRCVNANYLYETPFINTYTNKIIDNDDDVGVSAETWLYEYDKSFLVWADDIMDRYNKVEIVLWKNFNPWCISKKERENYKCKTPELDWTTFNAQLDGVNLLQGRQISNPAMLLKDDLNCMMNWVQKNTPDHWIMHQIQCIENVQDYWNDLSFARLKLNVTYPSEVSHRLWAMQLATAGEWV